MTSEVIFDLIRTASFGDAKHLFIHDFSQIGAAPGSGYGAFPGQTFTPGGGGGGIGGLGASHDIKRLGDGYQEAIT